MANYESGTGNPGGDKEKMLPVNEVDYLRLLMERFNFLLELRNTNLHRHVNLIGVVGAVLVALLQFGPIKGAERLRGSVHIASGLMLVLGACATVYDAMIRYRAEGSVQEALRIYKNAGIYRFIDHRQKTRVFKIFGEDFFYFSQFIVVNALPVIGFCIYFDDESFSSLVLYRYWIFVYISAVISYAVLWFVTYRLYSKHGPPDSPIPRTD